MLSYTQVRSIQTSISIDDLTRHQGKPQILQRFCNQEAEDGETFQRGTQLEMAKLCSETIMKPAITFHVEPEQIEEVARRVFREMLPASTSLGHEDAELTATKSRLARIMAKEFITISEVAFLLSCSEGHVRNLLKKAFNRETHHPIPARDLDGLFVFHREELLAWSLEAKTNGKRQQPALTCVK